MVSQDLAAAHLCRYVHERDKLGGAFSTHALAHRISSHTHREVREGRFTPVRCLSPVILYKRTPCLQVARYVHNLASDLHLVLNVCNLGVDVLDGV